MKKKTSTKLNTRAQLKSILDVSFAHLNVVYLFTILWQNIQNMHNVNKLN